MIKKEGSISLVLKNTPLNIGNLTEMPYGNLLIECFYVIREEKVRGLIKHYFEGGSLACYLQNEGNSRLLFNTEYNGQITGITQLDLELNTVMVNFLNNLSREERKRKESDRKCFEKVNKEIKELIK